jgi:signal transduction histidine kinase
LRDFDMNWVSRDGVRMAISLNTSLLRNASGEPYAMLNIARNITERKMLADSLSRTNRRVEMLNRIVSAANATLDISSIFGVVAREIISMVPCDVVALDLLADDRRSMEVRACHVTGEASAAYVGKVSPVEGTSAQRVIETREPVLFNEIPESGDILPAYAAEFASFLSIPVILNERVMGTLDLASREKAMFAPDDLALLQPIADQVGAAVQNALLYAQIQAQVERVHALYKVGESLAGAPDTEQVLQVIAEEMHHSLSYDRFVYAGMTPDGTLHVSRAFGVEGGDLVSDELVENDHRWLDHKEGVHAGDGTTPSMVTVSVRGKDRLHGVICLSRNAATPFEDADLRLAQSIATLAGIALDRVLLYEETLAKAEEIEARNRDLDDFTYVVSHDLKEPLITIEGYSSIVQQEFADTLDAEAVDYLRSIVQATERLKRLIDDLLTLSRVGRARHELEVVNAQDVLGAVIRDLEFTIRETHAVVLIPEPLPPVVYDSTQLGLVFRNLISNGIKFNTSDTPTVTVSFRESPDHHVFCIADNGIGIPDEYFGKIFVIFQRLHSAESFPGTGAGLTIVKKIVERHGGRIWVESEVGRGTYFYFSVPRHLTTTGT